MGEHSSHGHHSSHRHHRKHHSSRKRGFLNLRRKTGRRILVVCCVLIAALLVVGVVIDRLQREGENIEPHIELSDFDGDVSLVGGVVEEWMKWESSAQQLNNKYRQNGNIYCAKPVVISWMIYDVADTRAVVSQTLEISRDPDLETDVQVIEVSPGEHSASVSCLFVNTDYYYSLAVDFSDGSTVSDKGSFSTAWSPRIIDVDGVLNVRDIGGWTAVDGRKIGQGLLYRGSELDGAVWPLSTVTDAGIDVMTNKLHIKTDLDLRPEGLWGGKNVLGDGVTRRVFGSTAYSGIFTDEGKANMKAVFSEFSKEENYPIYLHCTYGADRTGTVCYVLESLIGMSEDDCYREWELTALDNGVVSHDSMAVFRMDFKALEGETQAEKAENYLLSAGVTEAEIASIREIFLGK